MGTMSDTRHIADASRYVRAVLEKQAEGEDKANWLSKNLGIGYDEAVRFMRTNPELAGALVGGITGAGLGGKGNRALGVIGGALLGGVAGNIGWGDNRPSVKRTALNEEAARLAAIRGGTTPEGARKVKDTGDVPPGIAGRIWDWYSQSLRGQRIDTSKNPEQFERQLDSVRNIGRRGENSVLEAVPAYWHTSDKAHKGTAGALAAYLAGRVTWRHTPAKEFLTKKRSWGKAPTVAGPPAVGGAAPTTASAAHSVNFTPSSPGATILQAPPVSRKAPIRLTRSQIRSGAPLTFERGSLSNAVRAHAARRAGVGSRFAGGTAPSTTGRATGRATPSVTAPRTAPSAAPAPPAPGPSTPTRAQVQETPSQYRKVREILRGLREGRVDPNKALDALKTTGVDPARQWSLLQAGMGNKVPRSMPRNIDEVASRLSQEAHFALGMSKITGGKDRGPYVAAVMAELQRMGFKGKGGPLGALRGRIFSALEKR
jgi:hypothetical protein